MLTNFTVSDPDAGEFSSSGFGFPSRGSDSDLQSPPLPVPTIQSSIKYTFPASDSLWRGWFDYTAPPPMLIFTQLWDPGELQFDDANKNGPTKIS